MPESTRVNLTYCGLQVTLGVNGVEEIHGLGPMTDYEKSWFEKLQPELKASIDKGLAFVNK